MSEYEDINRCERKKRLDEVVPYPDEVLRYVALLFMVCAPLLMIVCISVDCYRLVEHFEWWF